MKKILLSSALVAILSLTGCGSKEPTVDTTKDTAATQQQTATDSGTNNAAAMTTESVSDSLVVVDENGVAGADSNEMTMSGLESQMQSVHFDFDKFSIRPDMEDEMKNNANLAKGDAINYMIKLEGNCDEWGSDEYNFALGLKRANSTKSALVNEGVDAKRITMVSYGESNPICSDKTDACWAKNRRVDFKLLP
jgi:peptidoglycan-associated lipoprotein